MSVSISVYPSFHQSISFSIHLQYIPFFFICKPLLLSYLCLCLSPHLLDTERQNVTRGLIFYQCTVNPMLRDKFTSEGFVCLTSNCAHFFYENLYLVIPLLRVLPCPKTPISVMCNWIQKLHPGAPHKILEG